MVIPAIDHELRHGGILQLINEINKTIAWKPTEGFFFFDRILQIYLNLNNYLVNQLFDQNLIKIITNFI